ncbi:MAG: GGDEF domain-containing protein [Deltaproteobacteria bacterium]|nr:GGDEF domain-containing protein [Deltaproteobacteria bacterium]
MLQAVGFRDDRETVLDTAGPPPSTSAPGRACLIVLYGDDLGRRLPLAPDAAITFGRASGCEVVLDDATVSRRHARIAFRAGHYILEDFGSTNGVLVNQTRVGEARLGDGDQLRIGRTIYKFLQGGNIESEYHEVIYELMTNDGLTRARNRRFFDEELTRETLRATRYRRPLGLVIFDIDHFKKINDAHGHLGGDEVLRALAATVSGQVRREDVFARTGGEEFAVLVPEGTLEGVRLLAERLRRAIEVTAFAHDEVAIPVTCSFGVASSLPDARSAPKQLYERADAALYAAKRDGRNCVRG